MVEKKKEASAESNSAPKKQIVKSPKWPSLTLNEALNKAKVIYGYERRNPTTADVLLGHAGFKTRTGPANRTLAALRQYGLLEKKGELYHISDKAWKIFVLPEEDKERAALLREAALRPPLFKELVGLYSDGLPSDATLRSHLILNKKFNENTVERFLKIFKAALDVAKPFDNGYTPDASDADDDDDADEDEQDMETPATQTQRQGQRISTVPSARRQAQNNTPDPPEGMHFPLYLSKGKQAALYIPFVMSPREWELLKKQVAHSLDIAEAMALAEEEPPASPVEADDESEEE